MARADAAATGIAGDATRRATAIAAAVLCLCLVVKMAWAVATGGVGQLPFVVALFVLPLLYAFPGPRRFLACECNLAGVCRPARYRWQVLAVQAVLTWVPFAIYGGRWVVGIGGLLAGLVLLTVPGRVSWLLAGLLLAADLLVRATVVGLPFAFAPAPAPAWYGAVWAVVTFVDDALFFFGMVRLAQIVGEVQDARGLAAELAVGRERLQAAEALQSALGERLAAVGSRVVAAFQAIPASPARAREQVTAAGVAARDAVAQARAVTADRRSPPAPEPAAESATGAVISARLAWAVLVIVLLAYATQTLNNNVIDHDGPRLGVLVAVGVVASVALQLRHSWSARQGGRPRAWPLTLAAQAALAYAFFLPSLAAEMEVAVFLAGSVLLLVPGWRRWAGYAAVIVSSTALYATVPVRGITASDRGAVFMLNWGAEYALVGLLVYGLSRLAGLARQLEQLRGELTRMAVVRERLRVARDVHDLLGLGLSAIALKADLIAALIGRDDSRAAAEIEEMSRICAAASADIRLVTGDGQRLSLAAELSAARQILASAGIEVSASTPGEPLPGAANTVLAPVLREAVTNVLRHAAATACTIEVTARDGAVRLRVSNDGVPKRPAAGLPGEEDHAGRGLANLHDRVRAAGGQLISRGAGGWFDLSAEIPLPVPAGTGWVSGPGQGPAPGRPAGSR
jgi:two-component system sensor histidine kinase DesK